MLKLKDRIAAHKEVSDYKLTSRLPIIITINGRSFHKTTSLLNKPFCNDFANCMISTMNYLCTEIDGVYLAYYFNDEIVLVLKNDQGLETQPWCDNKIQKIVSLASSLATLHFSQLVDATQLNVLNDAIFHAQCFIVPNNQEAINTIIYKQQSNFYTSINYACFYELLNKYNEFTIKDMMKDISIDEKKDLLSDECQINFNDYPSIFRGGACAYKVPKIFEDKIKYKWHVNSNLPIFSKDYSLLSNVINNGHDIIRGK